MEEIIERLKKKKETISMMESCTGGYLSNMITNCEGSSEVFSFGAVTYSNEYKIKMGVEESIIDTYSVYSKECARSMAKAIANYTNSTYGIGVTGKMNCVDPCNLVGDNSTTYLSIYQSRKDCYLDLEIKMIKKTREENKKLVLEKMEEQLKSMI